MLGIPECGGMLSGELSILRNPEHYLVWFGRRLGGVIASRLLEVGYTRKPLDGRLVAARGSWFLVIAWDTNPVASMWACLVDGLGGFQGWQRMINHNLLVEFLVPWKLVSFPTSLFDVWW